MGSPLAPLLANWFVASIENKILEDTAHSQYKPIFYRRYVDDIFAVFRSSVDRDRFFEVLNSAHQNLQFTMETTSNRLPFLDVSITIQDAAFDTKVYRKPTNTGVLMNFQSMTPIKWKKTLIKCLLNRALRLSSSFDNLQSEIETITSHLKDNGHPNRLVKNIYKEFVERQFQIRKQT